MVVAPAGGAPKKGEAESKGVDIKNKTRKNANLNKLCWMSAVELAIVTVFDVLKRPCIPENYHHIIPVRSVVIL